MSSIKDRQRAAARARLEKEMAERATAARKRRQRQAIIGSAIAVVVIAGAAVWIASAMKDDTKTPAASASAAVPAGQVACTWTPAQPGAGKIKDVGLPPPTVPNTGSATLTMKTNLGDITATMDRSKVPCTAASFQYLGSKKFFDNSKCHRLVNQDKFSVLQCGDPFATGKGWRETDGTGGPSYTMAEENLPTATQGTTYPAGSIAMANTGQPNSTGSQFFIVAKDTTLPPSYTLLGKLTAGLNIVQGVVKAGDDGAFAQQAGGGHPKKEVVIQSMSVA